MGIRRADRIAIDAAGANPCPPAPLDGVIESEHERSARDEGGQQHTKQDETGMATIPDGTAQSPMIVLKMSLVGQTHHAQNARDGSFAGGENSPNQKNLHTAPDTVGKQGTKGKNDERQLRRQRGHETFYRLSVSDTPTRLRTERVPSPRPDDWVCQKWIKPSTGTAGVFPIPCRRQNAVSAVYDSIAPLAVKSSWTRTRSPLQAMESSRSCCRYGAAF